MSCSISLMCSDLAQMKVENGGREEGLREGGENKPARSFAGTENTRLSFCLLHPTNWSDCQIQMGHVVVVCTPLIPDLQCCVRV